MNLKYRGHNLRLEDPNICPHCHITNTPHHLWDTTSLDTDNIVCCLSAWQCSNSKCNKVFIVQHKMINDKFQLTRALNGLPKGPDWPQPIIDLKSGTINMDEKSIESGFIRTYLQSLEAEKYGLDELAGMGYRKAVEYLVKDWAIQNNPSEEEKISKSWLGSVINNYYEGDLKEILSRATWLGNDQAHYNKLFEEFDINILKELIDLIMVELDREYKKKHYIDLIKSKK